MLHIFFQNYDIKKIDIMILYKYIKQKSNYKVRDLIKSYFSTNRFYCQKPIYLQ